MKLKRTMIGLIILCIAEVISSIPAKENKNVTAAKLSKRTKNNKRPNKQDPKDFVTIKLHQATTTKDPFTQDVETLVSKGERKGVRIQLKKGGIRNTAEQLGQNLRKQIKNIGLGLDRRQPGRVDGADGQRKLHLSKGVKQVGIQVVRKRTTFIVPRPLPSADEDYLVYNAGDQPFNNYGGSNVNPITPFPNHLNPFDPRLTTSFQFDYRNSQTEGTDYQYP